eukprot:TRINITY_DN940_c0_g1_i15.p3 TRINITY_DN940_c0_g1~~TRINITY_DN940_c0_g1_i15.p3  ORF type:complete len:281 (+),score=73.94 TRINITY_DN940_c0_g1_i15:1298-2140(+)
MFCRGRARGLGGGLEGLVRLNNMQGSLKGTGKKLGGSGNALRGLHQGRRVEKKEVGKRIMHLETEKETVSKRMMVRTMRMDGGMSGGMMNSIASRSGRFDQECERSNGGMGMGRGTGTGIGMFWYDDSMNDRGVVQRSRMYHTGVWNGKEGKEGIEEDGSIEKEVVDDGQPKKKKGSVVMMRELIAKYGLVGFVVHESIWAVVLGSFYLMLDNGVDFNTIVDFFPMDMSDEKAWYLGSKAATLGTSLLLTKLTFPLRIAVTLSITPTVARKVKEIQGKFG